MKHKLIILGILALLGVFLIRGGITGYVISQSCCFGPDCASEDLCPTSATIENPAFLSAEDSNALSVVGMLIAVVSVMMIAGYLRMKTRQEKIEEEKEKEALNKE